jgi:hypothetical protein
VSDTDRALIDRVHGRLQLPVTVFAIGEADNE